MTDAFFVTGTDTEIGKTAVACSLLARGNAQGLRTAAVKPVAAGCDERGQNEDALALMAAMSETLAYQQVNPVALMDPIAPHIAAEREGRKMRASTLAGYCRGVMSSGADLVLIEGAGGWRVPINPRETLADVARDLGVGVIMVVGMRLGCINHALLTAEAIRCDGLKIAGWVANQCGSQMTNHAENVATLRSALGAPMLGELPHLETFDPQQAAQYLQLP